MRGAEMLKIRVIPCLDVKDGRVVKGVNFVSLRDAGDPVEQAIMWTPASTIAGLGVKARHAAYVLSQHWEAPIDRINWDARAVRLLIEAICDVAHTPLLLRNLRDDD